MLPLCSMYTESHTCVLGPGWFSVPSHMRCLSRAHIGPRHFPSERPWSGALCGTDGEMETCTPAGDCSYGQCHIAHLMGGQMANLACSMISRGLQIAQGSMRWEVISYAQHTLSASVAFVRVSAA